MSDDQRTELLRDCLAITERVSALLDQCYINHCRAAGIKPDLD